MSKKKNERVMLRMFFRRNHDTRQCRDKCVGGKLFHQRWHDGGCEVFGPSIGSCHQSGASQPGG